MNRNISPGQSWGGKSVGRIGFTFLLALLFGSFALLPAQEGSEFPPRKTIPFEEEEEEPVQPSKKIDLDDDLADLAAKSGAYYVRLEPLLRAAASTKNDSLKKLYQSYSVAHDRVVREPKAAKGKSDPKPTVTIWKATPVPLLWGRDKFPEEFGLVPLTEDFQPEPVELVYPKQIRSITPFERLVLAASNQLLNPSGNSPEFQQMPQADRLEGAEELLAAALDFHENAVKLNRRNGNSWATIRDDLTRRLSEVRATRLQTAVENKDWATIRKIGPSYAEYYRDDPAVIQSLYSARLAEAKEVIKADRLADWQRVRQLLDEYQARFPDSQDELFLELKKQVKAKAAKLFAEAERLALQNPVQARNVLRSVETLDPDLEGLRDKQRELRAGYSVLLVAARQMPERMTPATARFDSEKQAVELLFEGLTQPIPDPELGVRFHPQLVDKPPSFIPSGRELRLEDSISWAGSQVTSVDEADLIETTRMLAARPDTWVSDPFFWLEEPIAVPDQPGQFRFPLRLQHADPRALFTFKLLPGRWLAANGKTPSDIEFARKPFGSGPFRLPPNFRPAGTGQKPAEVMFVSNPHYTRRPGQLGKPFIKEIRFLDLEQIDDPVAAFRGDRLHILTDVPTADLPKYQADSGLNGRVQVTTSDSMRRVHILAINHRRPALQSVDLRRGLLHAVDRETVLNDVFRNGNLEYHRAMAGPFPPGSWAEPKPLGAKPKALFDRDLAAAKFKAYRSDKGVANLNLNYAGDDPMARSACERIKAAVEESDSGLTISLEPLDSRELLRRVQEEHRYDLAYMPFDFPNDWFPQGLASFLDPSATDPGGRNYLGYRARGIPTIQADGRLGELLDRCRIAVDPNGMLKPLAEDVHARFNETVPFVPLWQLDRHMVISRNVKIYLDGRQSEANPRWLEPSELFQSIANWRMD